jgi:hypothetical protein
VRRRTRATAEVQAAFALVEEAHMLAEQLSCAVKEVKENRSLDSRVVNDLDTFEEALQRF